MWLFKEKLSYALIHHQEEPQSSQLYEHLRDSSHHHDNQTLDAATEEQQKEQPVPNKDGEEGEKMEEGEDVEPQGEEQEEGNTEVRVITEILYCEGKRGSGYYNVKTRTFARAMACALGRIRFDLQLETSFIHKGLLCSLDDKF